MRLICNSTNGELVQKEINKSLADRSSTPKYIKDFFHQCFVLYDSIHDVLWHEVVVKENLDNFVNMKATS